MKTIYTIFLSLVLLSGIIFASENPKTDSPVAVVMKIIKDVSFKKGTNWASAKVGVPLSTADEIKTGDKSLALIKFTDNSLIRVRENSNLKIYAEKNKGDLSKNTYIDKGKVGFSVSHQENEEFRFTTPTMVASIRGTVGDIIVDGNGTSTLVLFEGLVDIKGTVGQKQSGTVKPGTTATIGQDGNIIVGVITPQQQQDSNSIKNTSTKKLIIKTSTGDLIIEYLGEQ